jgi:hypothetical protein
MGCLLALFAGFFPRLALFILWVARPARIDAAFDTPGRGMTGWDWFWVVVAALLDLGHWGAGASRRNQLPGRRASAT